MDNINDELRQRVVSGEEAKHLIKWGKMQMKKKLTKELGLP